MSLSRLLLLLVLTLTANSQDSSSQDIDVTDESIQKEQYSFQAEVASLMDIIINSLYLNKEVFIRELISNASDAMDKVRLTQLKEGKELGDELEIRIKYDPENKTLAIRDRGVGMTKADLVDKLGTVAKTGTTQFLDAISSQGADASLIGQFGVGFYSSFLVANKVTVVSKHEDDVQHIWISSAGPNFQVVEDPRGNTLGRGTEVILHLKQDAEEFLEAETIKKYVQLYSEFIDYPIMLYEYKDKSIEVDMTEEELEEQKQKYEEKRQEKLDKREKEAIEREEKGEDPIPEEDLPPLFTEREEEEFNKKTKHERKKVWEWAKINAQKAIWLKEKSENTIPDYVRLYQTLKKDGSEPLYFTHFHGEGDVDFRAIVFIPESPPSDMFENYYNQASGLRLYVRRVLITEEYENLVPKYLNFLRGVIHSDDLPLNVSRETLQQERVMKILGNKVTKKVLESLKKLADGKTEFEVPDETEDEKEKKDDEYEEKNRQIMMRWRRKDSKAKYKEFWEQYSKNIKLGVMEDSNNRNRLAELLRFHSLKNPKEFISFDDYISNMAEDQEYIYYLAGEELDALKESPLVEKFKQLDYDVLLMDDPLDEFCMSYINEYGEKKFQNIARTGIKFTASSGTEERKTQKLKEHYQVLIDWWKELLGKEVDKVTVSNRLIKSPIAISSGEGGYTANMERITRAQAYANQQKFPSHMIARKVLEIHPGHPAIRKLMDLVETEPESLAVKDYGWLLYYTATIPSGFPPREDNDYTARMYRVLRNKMKVSPSEPISEPEVPSRFFEEDDQETNEDVDSLDEREAVENLDEGVEMIEERTIQTEKDQEEDGARIEL